MRRSLAIIGLAAMGISLAFALASPPAWAQAASQVTGTVQDALERPIAGADLALEAPDGAVVARTTSGADGSFEFTGAAPGSYAIVATSPGFGETTAIVVLTWQGAQRSTLTMTAEKALSLEVSAKRLDLGRTGIEVQTGSSLYHIGHQAMQQLPEGENTSVQQVLAQAPGVVQDMYGQVHIRGGQGNSQYRIDGITLPEGVTGFGNALDARFADSVDLLDGALPAEYGYRTDGVVEITTKNGYIAPGGRIGIYEGIDQGAQIFTEPSFQYGGTAGGSSWYLDGAYTKNPFEIGGPDTGFPSHDISNTGRGFAYLSSLVNPTTKVSVIAGTAVQTSQIPVASGVTSNITVTQNGKTFNQSNYPSQDVNDVMLPANHYGIIAVQGASGDTLNYQVALFRRYSDLRYSGDPIGDLLYNQNGVGSDTTVAPTVDHCDIAGGVQADSSFKANTEHTIRFGISGSDDNATIDNTSRVFNTDPTTGNPILGSFDSAGNNFLKKTANQPPMNAQLYGAYVQDEWQILSPLTLNYGLRYDDMAGFLNTNQLSPRVGLVYKPIDVTTLHAGYSRYFTPPSTELISPAGQAVFAGTTNDNSQALQNSRLVPLPERDNYYDLGVSQTILAGWTAGLDGYFKDAQDLQDLGQFGGTPIFSVFNYARGWDGGVEFSTAFQNHALSTYLNLTVHKAEGEQIVTGQYAFDQAGLNYLANHYIILDDAQLVTSSAGFVYDLAGMQLGLDALYGTGLHMDSDPGQPDNIPNGATLPPWFQFNADVARNFELPGFGKFDARLAVVNLLDNIYELRSASTFGITSSVYAQPRTFYLGIAKEF